MIVSAPFAGKRYAVLGLARSGMATVETLLASGAEVTAWDRREGPREQFAGRATIADPLVIDLVGSTGLCCRPVCRSTLTRLRTRPALRACR
jgi:UDP-N-acetylmuramoylalanine--D-glutamate ligase